MPEKEFYRVRLYSLDTNRQFAATADNGHLHLAAGERSTELPPQFATLSLDQVDSLISALPALRNWMASGRPAHGPYEEVA